MTEQESETRTLSRKRVKLCCHLQLMSGVTISGYTHEISGEGILMEAQCLPRQQQSQAPKAGDVGIVCLQYKKQGAPASLKVSCRIMHTTGNGIGIHIFFSKLSNSDQQDIAKILETGSDTI